LDCPCRKPQRFHLPPGSHVDLLRRKGEDLQKVLLDFHFGQAVLEPFLHDIPSFGSNAESSGLTVSAPLKEMFLHITKNRHRIHSAGHAESAAKNLSRRRRQRDGPSELRAETACYTAQDSHRPFVPPKNMTFLRGDCRGDLVHEPPGKILTFSVQFDKPLHPLERVLLSEKNPNGHIREF
jgi:hypothetical protein